MAQGRGMSASPGDSKAPKEKPYSHPDRHYEVRDAMHTIMRAGDHLKNPSLMKEVRKHAAKHAHEKRAEADRAMRLAKQGRISERQLAKLDKLTPVA